MCALEKLPDIGVEPWRKTLVRFCIAVIFSIAFGYIEAAVVVYLRAIFHPDGFTFPLEVFSIDPVGKRLLLTEVGREAATIVLVFASAWLFGGNTQQRFAYFLTIFSVWDIFYYVWLKVLIDWPGSIMDWDILFLMPLIWASPVLYPVLISLTLLVFAVIILYRCSCDRPIKVTLLEWLGFFLAGVVVVVSFCIAGQHITERDFESYFYWPLFAVGHISAIVLFIRCLLKAE